MPLDDGDALTAEDDAVAARLAVEDAGALAGLQSGEVRAAEVLGTKAQWAEPVTGSSSMPW